MEPFILGAAQLGLNYGINNKNGKPSEQKTIDMLDYAFLNGVDCIDTATAYGDSEERIGSFIKASHIPFKLCTKLPPLFDVTASLEEVIYEQVTKSLYYLNVGQIYLYYLHSFEHCKSREILNALIKLKCSGEIKQIGVSIYDPLELKYIFENLADVIDVVQIPFSIFDCVRWKPYLICSDDLTNRISIFSRSTYLQGLVFKSVDDEFVKKMQLSSQIDFINKMAFGKSISLAKLAVDFSRSFTRISSIIVGCETIEQLKQNIELFNSNCSLDADDLQCILNKMGTINEVAIDPRKW